MSNISIIIPTKDRPIDMARCLKALHAQHLQPQKVIVVDSSASDATSQVIDSFTTDVSVQYFKSTPSTTRQRNIGLDAVPDTCDIVLMIDDDIELPTTAVQQLADFFQRTPQAIGATVALNDHTLHGWFKRWFGRFTLLYTSEPYGLTKGLFNIVNQATIAQPIAQRVDWLPGGCMAYRWSVIKQLRFDEWFTDYGLAEDLEFSIRASRLGELWVEPAIVAVHHDQPATSATTRNWKLFGAKRITNRWYIVRKHFRHRVDYIIGYIWATSWLISMNCVRAIYSKRYRAEFVGNLQGIWKLLR